jgi:hypothetical protein
MMTSTQEMQKRAKAAKKNAEWLKVRTEIIAEIKGLESEMLSNMMEIDLDDGVEIMERYNKCMMNRFCNVTFKLYDKKLCTSEQIHDAAWEAFDGLLQANMVLMNLKVHCGMEVNDEDYGIQVWKKSSDGADMMRVS